MPERPRLVRAFIVLLVLALGGLGALGWMVNEQRREIERLTSENEIIRRDLEAVFRALGPVRRLTSTRANPPLMERVDDLGDAVGTKPADYPIRAEHLNSTPSVWDELHIISTEVRDIRTCLDLMYDTLQWDRYLHAC